MLIQRDLFGAALRKKFKFCSQNVNRWSRWQFIALRIQYGTEISRKSSTIHYNDTYTFQFLEGVFFMLLAKNVT